MQWFSNTDVIERYNNVIPIQHHDIYRRRLLPTSVRQSLVGMRACTPLNVHTITKLNDSVNEYAGINEIRPKEKLGIN